ncbi:AGE family epimerase/isomerase [Aeromonas hydrophila]|uniref:AGE family epimerase/isomerase n=1 Tax=Aeromonas hydrophila TaxID=644 RepID=A0A926FP30_AERHY|nr:AGE family epimerase/isomerase [Aeromonas hydrophila]
MLDELTDDGRPHRATSRLWCQTEQLKALLAAYEWRGRLRQPAGLVRWWGGSDYYLMPALPGQWLDQVDVTGRRWPAMPRPAPSITCSWRSASWCRWHKGRGEEG